jgi:peptidoglycan/xylan/chitin deacetylase (PgdA/CDA1 family)
MRLYRPLSVARLIFPDALFRLDHHRRKICLTFDDGPDKVSTPEILNILGINKVNAVFFCKGSLASDNLELIRQISSYGHIIGNHGYYHLDGWRTGTEEYCRDVELAAGFTSREIFRPPYGRIGIRQFSILKKQFRIFFWDVLPYDFDKNIPPEKCLLILKRKIRNGSIIALHDSPSSKVTRFLDEFIKYAKEKDYEFVLPDHS